MRPLIATALLTLGLGATAQAAQDQEIEARDFPALASLEQVESITALTRLHSWTAVDDDTLIVWATPFDPYLVELYRRSPELKFAQAIGVTSFGSRIHARFDSVKVDGFSYPIRSIYKLSRDEAEEWSERS